MSLPFEDDSLRIAVRLSWAPHCAAPINANIVERRWMLRAGMDLAVGGVRGYIHHKHANINNIIYRAMTAAGLVERRELSGLLHSDGKRPDNVSEILWWSGKFLVWEATCVDTIAPYYRSQAAHEAGAVAARAES